ncbi:MAG: NADP-specific glutamate dehydrogenase [Roseitalea porphyridii]|jgi:glutamate dehydrogenase (NADP+)|uniref:NADP-specific glutamate dehydrogenase n=1 Tax=Roseitalea porphyridii TaxID=1852022 RepID=UPI0032EF96BF
MTERDDDGFLDWLAARNAGEDEFLEAVRSVHRDIAPVLDANEAYREAAILERLSEPDRIISFRVTWQDDDGAIRVNRGWRVQHSSAIGPYKGGLRFAPSVDQSVLKFLAFEQTFKNALTGLPMGSAKGGADFDPRRRSEGEVMRFCQAFMQELYRHIGPNTDIPAGDINVGEREIGFLFGQYKKITNTFSGAMTGKGLEYGGAPMRPEATGFGLAYFVGRMLEEHDRSIEGRAIALSGAGNVAMHAARKALELGGRPVTLSNSDGFLHAESGFASDDLDLIERSEARLEALADRLDATWHGGDKPWGVECDIALPCATQNELDGDDARALVGNGVVAVAEGANMPCTADAIECLQSSDVIFGPAKAANAGGVALSGLEMSQNAAFQSGDREHLGERLKAIMCQIHDRCLEHCGEGDVVDYARGANIAGFRKVADAMLSFGVS